MRSVRGNQCLMLFVELIIFKTFRNINILRFK